ncbi:hypothetical protein CS063_06210 [Sporanaerobium hydrogeniformans]|uniref:Uncharacterized protein n=1 Tax=Sporanaerobium hydrogeniformans TaxID=3072179 RepID=A0AC61DDL5_9FIRM|nr:O-antigen ligase family protein [Sporanaerobium hydrogeniformans]PHV71281.1 hypothetical protein CS063_06210 [Sporanaerobium hydrogeniformans]
MENSLFGSMLLYFWMLYKDSYLYKLLTHLYAFVERLFVNSFFYSLLVREGKKRDYKESRTYKIFYTPFRCLEWIGNKISLEGVRQSCVLGELRRYIWSVFSLNTNLIGAFLVSFTALYALLHRGLNKYVVIGAIGVGIIGILMNRDGMRIIEHSKVMQAVFYLLDFKIDFDFYVSQDRLRHLIYGIGLGVLTAATGAQIGPVMASVLVAAFTALFMIFYRPEYGLYAVVFVAPLLGTKFVLPLVFLTILSLVVKSFMEKGFKWVLDEVGLLIMGLLVVFFVASLYSYSRMSSFVLWFIYLCFMGFYLISVNITNKKEVLMNVVKFFILSGTLVALYGIMQYVFGWNVNNGWVDQEMFEDLKMRAYSTLENPNVLGAYLILSTSLGMGLVCTKQKLLPKLVYLGCTGIMILCLALTYSRGCWLGFGVAIIIFMTFYNGRLWGLFIPALLVAPLVLPDSIINRFASIGNMEESSTLVRVKIWMSSLRMVGDFLWTGVGMGTGAYGYVYPFYAYYYVFALHSHNTFIQLLLDGGIMALVLFLALILVFIRKMATCYTKAMKIKDKDIAIITLGMSAGVIGFLVQGVFDHLFYNYRLILIFFVFIALAMSFLRVINNKEASL